MNEKLALELEVDNYIKQKKYRLINSLLFYKDGELILERYYNKYNQNSKNNIKSIWKSILSICTGIALEKGYIKSLDEPISNYLSEFAQKNHAYHKLITIRHLLTMTSGIYWNSGIHYHCPMLEQMWQADNCIEHISDIAMDFVPGNRWQYKEWDVILLSALLSKASSMDTFEFCKKNLYDPLGITSGRWAKLNGGVDYNISKQDDLESESNLSAHDLAKIGFLLLNKGEDIVSESYIKEAITPLIDPHYGMLFWIYGDKFCCRGYGGQEINVLPKENIVYVLQATPTPRSKSYYDVFDLFYK